MVLHCEKLLYHCHFSFYSKRYGGLCEYMLYCPLLLNKRFSLHETATVCRGAEEDFEDHVIVLKIIACQRYDVWPQPPEYVSIQEEEHFL